MKKTHSKKSRGLVRRASESEALYNILEGGGIHSVDTLADEMNRSKGEVRRLIAEIRKGCREGSDIFEGHVFTTRGGWTLDQKPEHAAYETRMRFRMGFGCIVNGQPAYKALKKLDYKMFESVRLEFQPKLLALQDFSKK